VYLLLVQAAEAAQPSAAQGPWAWLLQYLPVVGWPAVIVAVALGSWRLSSFLTKADSRAANAEKQLDAVVSSNLELKQTLEGQVTAQRELAQSVHQLAEAMNHQSDLHSEQLGLIREMSAEQKLLAQNQMTIMNGFQRVVEQLISAVSDKD